MGSGGEGDAPGADMTQSAQADMSVKQTLCLGTKRRGNAAKSTEVAPVESGLLANKPTDFRRK